MNASTARKISRLFPGFWNRQYVPTKLRTDPLYAAVYEQIRGSAHPLLDLGCGLGLLSFYLRLRGLSFPIRGFDYDQRKILAARRAVSRGGFAGLEFSAGDARLGLPAHSGCVAILDILQFFSPAEQESLLRQAALRLAPGAKLVIRSGLRDMSWRFRITVAGDWLAKASRWMKAGPKHYPVAGDFTRVLSEYGTLDITPLWGRTPFNNHLIVLTRGSHVIDIVPANPPSPGPAAAPAPPPA